MVRDLFMSACINFLSVGHTPTPTHPPTHPHPHPHIYTGPNLVIIMPADALAPNGARPSAGTVLITKLDMSSCKFISWPVFLYHLCGPHNAIQNSWRNLTGLWVLMYHNGLTCYSQNTRPPHHYKRWCIIFGKKQSTFDHMQHFWVTWKPPVHWFNIKSLTQAKTFDINPK